MPRDRQARFDPQLIAKYQRRFPGFDDKIISMYARGMSTRSGGLGRGRFLATLCEHELAEQAARRIARHLAQSDLSAGKTLTSFDFAATPSLRKAHLAALAAGDAWIEQRANVLIFGPRGTGKTHAAAAIRRRLIDHGYRVLFTRTTDLVQKLRAARRDLALPAALAKLEKFDVAGMCWRFGRRSYLFIFSFSRSVYPWWTPAKRRC